VRRTEKVEDGYQVCRLITAYVLTEIATGKPAKTDTVRQFMKDYGGGSQATFYRDMRLFKQVFPKEKSPARLAHEIRRQRRVNLWEKRGENIARVMEVSVHTLGLAA
jgi:hypothetical protein